MTVIINDRITQGEYFYDRNAFVMNNEPMVLHCHHYNCFLQYSIESAHTFINSRSILIDSAQELAYSQFSNFFSGKEMTFDEKINAVTSLHSYAGYGSIDLSSVSLDGGVAISESNHYADGWISKFGARAAEEPGVAFFTSGFIAGAMDAIDGTLGRYSANQTKCKTKGGEVCKFVVVRNHMIKSLESSPEQGDFMDNIQLDNSPLSDVNYVGIREALTGMKIEGNEDGVIPAFGVSLTRMYSNYYGLISYRFLKEMKEKVGDHGIKMVEELLIEAGHVCAFNTFGGIMQSAEWYGLIHPMLKTREDWVHGIVACSNALGWGHIEVGELVPGEKLILKVKSGYENNMYLKKYGESDRPKAFLMTGAVAGIMNLLYQGDITAKPELSEQYYESTFKSENRFEGKQTKCRTLGDEYDEFVATRIVT